MNSKSKSARPTSRPLSPKQPTPSPDLSRFGLQDLAVLAVLGIAQLLQPKPTPQVPPDYDLNLRDVELHDPSCSQSAGNIMKQSIQFWLGFGIACAYTLTSQAQAQPVPDATLPNNSVVTNLGFTSTITGGTRAGRNLFHSFSEFSVPTKGEAFFNNALDIQNIISRVTGGSVSNIDGLIRANGSANLFLINPNGIVFGPNATLNIGGSFLGSTANSLNFADGTSFSATNPQAAPLLTISVPVGLQFGRSTSSTSNGQHPGAIRVQGTGYSISSLRLLPTIGAGSSLTGLRVQPGNTLALVGGDVTLEGGTLTAKQGRIELGSVGDGLVSLNPTTQGWNLGYEGVPNFNDIRLSEKALVDASGSSGGSIQLSARQVTLTNGSIALIQNQGVQPAGAIFVNASESLELSGRSPDGVLSVLTSETVGPGRGSDIAVKSRRLLLQGGQINTNTFSAADAGNIIVNAPESVQLIGLSPASPGIIGAATYNSGRAGDITVSTGRLTAKDGGAVISVTLGTGSGGNVNVNATDSIELIGVDGRFSPSTLSAASFNVGNGGSLTINTSRLTLWDGGRVGASTEASGNAGDVTINASESVEVSGTVPGSVNPSLVISSANVVDEALQQLYSLPAVPSGASGNVTINTGRLRVTDDALVNVRNDGSGNAGTLRVNARSIFLDNQGGITAATASGEGGNISLEAQNLQLRNNSAITASVGGTGNGGNIMLNTDILAALENSNIIANAVRGRGGNIQINTQGIFRSPDRDITASSQLGINGTVQINTLGINPSLGLVNLPVKPVNVTGLIAQGCPADVGLRASKFVVTGRGGLPPTPREALRSEPTLVDLGTTVTGQENHASAAIPSQTTSSEPAPLVEATGWVTNGKGEVVLVAQAPTVTLDIPWLTPTTCHAQ